MLPLVDVIIPVYNAEQFLHKCLDSVIAQTYKNLRILIINDGSKDGSLEIIKEYSEKDTRIEYINQENKGIGATRNIALNNLKGDYFYFLDSDDYIANDAIELLVNTAIAENADIVVGQIKGSNNQNLTKDIHIKTIELKDRNLFYSNYVFNNQLYYSTAAKLIRKESVGPLRYDNTISFGEDLLFNLCLYTKISKVSIEKGSVYIYVDNEDSVTRKKKPNRCYDQFKVCEGFYNFIKNNNIYEEYKLILAQLLWMCIISGINLSHNEGGDYHLIVDFLKFATSHEIYRSFDNALLKAGGKTWADIEGKTSRTRTLLKLEISVIRIKWFILFKLIL